jgi:hypothetical protein
MEQVPTSLWVVTWILMGKLPPIRRTSRHQLRTLAFTIDGREYQAIEQNAEKPSRWGNWRERGMRLSSSRT